MYLPPNTITLCIPRVDVSIHKKYIQNTFELLQIGKIINILEYNNKYNVSFKKILIFIQLNNSSENANVMKSRLKDKKDVKIVHNNDLLYWKVVEAKKQPFT